MAGVQTGDAISPKRSILGTTANGCVGWTAELAGSDSPGRQGLYHPGQISTGHYPPVPRNLRPPEFPNVMPAMDRRDPNP